MPEQEEPTNDTPQPPDKQHPDNQNPDNQNPDTQTQHGHWTPDVAEAADREMRDLAEEPLDLPPATEGVDKSHLSVPPERHNRKQ
ncbi:hypothetical protein DEIPH_ctg064orf0031 [Deinococcus phoenicis]|uniref:Uncharacterized protein n=1 Tax=Deinococcus phoenicis TaxID=1476583 RepID=A0A016QLJ4_9DEIO|nr:hypothetical protein [Deinococcus phoenicis]EYB66866.1 hypothetical protein DEIPH_ctg064orf0031 [Deinococcus phoenicis]